jgi:hypothetical protein
MNTYKRHRFHHDTISYAVLLPNARAHDLYESWDAEVTPLTCLIWAESGWERDDQYDTIVGVCIRWH